MGLDPDLAIVMKGLDEYRDYLPEGKYIKMCDALKRLHEKLKKTRLRIPTIRFTTMDVKYIWWFSSLVTIVKITGDIKRKFTSS